FELLTKARMFKHFHENKVEIASAITKPFPFLMSLQDRGFISEQKFQVSEENELSPDSKPVVYDILSDLQKKFSLPLLQVIFSTTHLKAYPDLKETMRSFLDGNYSSHLSCCPVVPQPLGPK
uniref:HSR domain-containing protein n=1 Tax=Peromyscus maniculatus bairdii TaxID=230844 RepID=A0A8C8W5J2_PERMB